MKIVNAVGERSSKGLRVHFIADDDSMRTLCGRKVASTWHPNGVVALPLDLIGNEQGGIYDSGRHCRQCARHPDYALSRLAELP